MLKDVCTRCGAWKLAPQHNCPPLHLVREHGAEDWSTVHAYDPGLAASRYAGKLDRKTETPADRVIEVRVPENGVVLVFDTSHEFCVDYHATARI